MFVPVHFCNIHVLMFSYPLLHYRHPATAKWYDRRDSVFIEFCVADSKDVKVSFDKTKFGFRYVCLKLQAVFNHEFPVKCLNFGSPLTVLLCFW